MGNEFGNVKLRVTAASNEFEYRNGSTRIQMTNGVPQVIRFLDSSGNMVGISPLHDFGGFFAGNNVPGFSGTGTTGLDSSARNGICSNAIAAMSPIQSKASVLTTLLELVSGDVPGLLKDLRKHVDTITSLRAAAPKGVIQAGSAVGGAYLENVFAWTPILKDITAAVEVLTTIDQLLFPEDNTRRTFDRVIHERWGSLTTTAALGNRGVLSPSGGPHAYLTRNSDALGTTIQTPSLSMDFTAREKVDVRCTARFSTALVPSAQSNGYVDRMAVLLGLELSPAVLWELVPWSWLIDWFTNIGSVVENLSNIHMSNVILNYAYATFNRKTVAGVWMRRPPLVTSGSGFLSFRGDVIFEYTLNQKVRVKASPYGFGVSPSSLSGEQWAVLVALGLARSR
jgi:hypothetical protein